MMLSTLCNGLRPRRVRGAGWLCVLLVWLGGAAGAPARAQESLPEGVVGPLLEQVLEWRDLGRGWAAPGQRFVGRFADGLEGLDVREGPLAHDPELWRLALLCATFGDSRRTLGDGGGLRLAAAGRALLDDLQRGPGARSLQAWLLTDVLVAAPGGSGRAPDHTERKLALELALAKPAPGLKTALLAVVRRDDDPLEAQVLDALADWCRRFGADEAVDRCLVQQLSRGMKPGDGRHPMTLLLRRLESCGTPLGPQAAELLEARLRTMVIQPDWRQPARAIRLLGALPLEGRVGVLLDALVIWDRRARGSKRYDGLIRTRSDLSRALQELSGKRFGPEPGPWIDWWVDVRLGRELRPGTEAFEARRREREEDPGTRATFFGLRPDSDRVTFVIDISGSMSNRWGTTQSTRFEEAVEQLVRFLQAAPEDTRFNVILFNQAPLASSVALVEASAENLARARQSLLARTPGGGTNPRLAIEQALLLDRAGMPDVDALEADTVIVLCDGATDQGSAWVKPFLDRILPLYPIRFHSVLIGSEGDGTLRALAEQSGGQYRRVGG